jgi:hypothetical protein
MTEDISEYSISETKKLYCEINSKVALGFEVITCNSRSNQKISHLKKEYVDFLLNRLHFRIHKEFDKDLKGYSYSDSVEDLINSIMELSELYKSKMDIFSKTESIVKQIYMLKILRCNKDRDLIKKELGLSEKKK